jgi:hypothetical protein
MAKRDSAQPHAVFDELVAINVPDVATKTSGNESRRQYRILIVAFRIGMRAAGYQRMCARTQGVRNSKLAPRAPSWRQACPVKPLYQHLFIRPLNQP